MRCKVCGDSLTEYEIDRGCDVCDFCARDDYDDDDAEPDDAYEDWLGLQGDDETDPQQEGWRP
jgi:hypothetical protein